jgi:hypothetical protein
MKSTKQTDTCVHAPGVVVHSCNSSYSGGGRRIVSLKPARAKVAVRPCLKNEIKIKGLRVLELLLACGRLRVQYPMLKIKRERHLHVHVYCGTIQKS